MMRMWEGYKEEMNKMNGDPMNDTFRKMMLNNSLSRYTEYMIKHYGDYDISGLKKQYEIQKIEKKYGKF
jgi:hypothetical protein